MRTIHIIPTDDYHTVDLINLLRDAFPDGVEVDDYHGEFIVKLTLSDGDEVLYELAFADRFERGQHIKLFNDPIYYDRERGEPVDYIARMVAMAFYVAKSDK